MRKIVIMSVGILLLLVSGCKKTATITSSRSPSIDKQMTNEVIGAEPVEVIKPSLRFATAYEIKKHGGYAINESDFERALLRLGKDKEFIEKARTLSRGGLEFPIPCDRLIGYLEELIGIDLDNVQCLARGKLMLKPSLDLWIAGNLAYAIDLGGYIGAAGFAGFSGSIAGAQELGLLTMVYINNILDTLMNSYNYENPHIAFNAGFVVWTSETGGVTIDITTDHSFSNGTFDWTPQLTASYSF